MRTARWGWLVTTLALGIALLATSWANHRSARSAVETLHQGQAEILEDIVRDHMRRLGPDIDDAELDSIHAALDEEGLRYVALVAAERGIVAESGEPLGQLPRPGPPMDGRGQRMRGGGGGEGGGPFDLAAVGDRIRTYTFAPRRMLLVLEFEPVVATRLVARSLRSLILGIVGAAVLSLAALVFWRMSQRYEAAERRMEQQRRLSILGEMSAVLAHEIRNPLASLKGNAQLLAERLNGDGAEARRARRVVAEATRLEALTTDLLDFARSGPLDLRPTDPVAMVREAAEEVGAVVAIEAVDPPATWPLDPLRFRQVLVNLLRNADQAVSDGAPAVASITRDGEALVVKVRDFGPGLPADDAERVFDPFFTTRTQGTGLGLSVARRVVEMHGGVIEASNHPDGGALFTVRLPKPEGAAWRAS